jgi:DNA polymerase I
MLFGGASFREVWFVDFEFIGRPGERAIPVCMVACEARSGRLIRVWKDDLIKMSEPPFDIGRESLYIGYFVSAEISCHLALGWPLPHNVLDLYVEFRNHTNGRYKPNGNGLLGAMSYFGLDCLAATEKEYMREKILSGGPWTEQDKTEILDYCQTDVDALARLLPKMEPSLDVKRGLLRGRYMASVARMEHGGIPWDTAKFNIAKTQWDGIKARLIHKIDGDYGVFENGVFKRSLFEKFLIERDIPWPKLASGALDLQDDTFREMARSYPVVAPIRELRSALSKLKLSNLAIGSDQRNRVLLSPFASKTGRNQPSTAKFAFGPDTWIRSFIKPEPGRSLAYLDYEQQEFGIAAFLSKDPLMIEAYQSGDPYLSFAKQAKAVPQDASKESHKAERDLFKACALAVQYGMGAQSLAYRIGKTEAEAKDLLRLHHETYRKFWQWSDAVVDHAFLYGKLWTTFGWHLYLEGDLNDRSIRNFLMQANGAEMLRLAIIIAFENGVSVVAPVHDAILIEADSAQIDEAVVKAGAAMQEASRIVLSGAELRTEPEIIKYPDRFKDERGEKMWDTVWGIIGELQG